MRLYGCNTCHQTYQVGGDVQEIQNLLTEDNYPCITAGCPGRLSVVGLHYYSRSCQETPLSTFYRAIYGFGSAKGEAASLARFVRLLKTKRIVSIDAEPVGQPERVIVRKLVLEDGTRLHFEASSKGACCYYIEEAGPTCREVVEDELRRAEGLGSGNEAGEEGRRTTEDGRRGAEGEGTSPSPNDSADQP